MNLVISKVNDTISELNSSGSIELRNIDKAILRQSKVINNFLDVLKINGVSPAVAAALKEAEEEKQRLEIKRAEMMVELQPIEPIDVRSLEHLLDRFEHAMSFGTNKQKRQMIRAFVSRMTFDPDTGSVQVYFWPSPFMDPGHYIKKAKHIFLCFARLEDRNLSGIRRNFNGGGDGSICIL